VTTLAWSPQQDAALSAVSRWLRERSAPFFYLAGYAGTGKTTLAKHFAQDAGDVLFASFTGKAAAVMRNKGCTGATTIHRLIYTARTKGSARLKELRERLEQGGDAMTPAARKKLQAAIRDELKSLRAPAFDMNPSSDVRHADLLIIDECSMVNERMGKDLLSFGVPVLVLGDPAQLPPVASGGFFTEREPDFMLTEVHRQAEASGILRLATMVRSGQTLAHGEYGDARVIRRAAVVPDEVMAADQVLVGRNGTRRATNARMRQLLGRAGVLPEAGDRLVCLRNNHDLGLLNGEIWDALDAQPLDTETIGLTIQNGDLVENVVAWTAPFEGRELSTWDHDKEVQEFDYGNALTVHKAQGSQWPSVFVFDESWAFRKDAARWLYTAVTRAADKLVVVR